MTTPGDLKGATVGPKAPEGHLVYRPLQHVSDSPTTGYDIHRGAARSAGVQRCSVGGSIPPVID